MNENKPISSSKTSIESFTESSVGHPADHLPLDVESVERQIDERRNPVLEYNCSAD